MSSKHLLILFCLSVLIFETLFQHSVITKRVISRFFLIDISSVIRQKSESQSGGNKKTKHAKFSDSTITSLKRRKMNVYSGLVSFKLMKLSSGEINFKHANFTHKSCFVSTTPSSPGVPGPVSPGIITEIDASFLIPMWVCRSTRFYFISKCFDP